MSFVPYLQSPPTHTQTGSAPTSASPSTFDVTDDAAHKAAPVTSLGDPYGPRRWASNLVQLPGKNRALNEFSVERIGESVENNLVMLHGYGAGLGFYYKNFEALSREPGWKLYALDLLGMGRSSRPPFRINAKDREGKIKEAENWFIDALEEWRIARKIERFTLLGHSLGGYMAVAYALKYPGRLNKLILASPVGIPEDPYAVNDALPEPGDAGLANEFLQSQDEAINGPPPGVRADNNNFLNARSKREAAAAAGSSGSSESKDGTSTPPKQRPYPKWLVTLWDANISPFSLVRWTGPLGPRLVSGWTSRRFSHLPEGEAQALHDYSYSLFRQRGSGEYALAYVLAPGAFARSPLIRRIQGVGRQWLQPHATPTSDVPQLPEVSSPQAGCFRSSPSSSNTTVTTPAVAPVVEPALDASGREGPPRKRETGIPIVFMYGDNDWMDVAGGYAAEHKINETRARLLKEASVEEKAAENGSAKVVIIQKAGHHVYLDGWEQFNEVMLEEMKDTGKWVKKNKEGKA